MEILRVEGDPAVAEVAVMRYYGDDRKCVECVDGLAPPLPREQKWIINLSTQFGCPVGCPFCDAAFAYHGNLAAEDLLAQVRWGIERHPARLAAECAKLKVHFARMGEPAMNPACLEAARALPELIATPGLWCCMATVAPRGREAWFDELADIAHALYPGRFQLQFSVQSTAAADRRRLTPIDHWSLAEIAAYGRAFHRPDDRRVVLNFALARDVAFEPEVIQEHFDPEHFAIKLTPVNPTARGAEHGFETVLRSERQTAIAAACDALTGRGFDVVLSIGDEREDQVGSNCGQAVRVERGRTASARRPAPSGQQAARLG
jgi:23S rRNA (adenine2503-C2)-methyltransferase